MFKKDTHLYKKLKTKKIKDSGIYWSNIKNIIKNKIKDKASRKNTYLFSCSCYFCNDEIMPSYFPTNTQKVSSCCR